jgi:uncharacterized protein (TIGR02145 family)
VVATQQSCNQNEPNWGTISFQTNNEWTISGHGITQIWSDAVTTTECQQRTANSDFASGPNGNVNASCRATPNDHPGDFFTWCAVVRFADILCPYPWRVPTRQDFINLDIALARGHADDAGGNRQETIQRIGETYIAIWGGSFGGNSASNGMVNWQGGLGSYWTQTESSENNGNYLTYGTLGVSHVDPRNSVAKNNGMTLRCVR